MDGLASAKRGLCGQWLVLLLVLWPAVGSLVHAKTVRVGIYDNPPTLYLYLNFWGEVYVACRLGQARIEFEEFLENPQTWLARLGIEDALKIMAAGFLPLMPEQARVRRRWWSAVMSGRFARRPNSRPGLRCLPPAEPAAPEKLMDRAFQARVCPLPSAATWRCSVSLQRVIIGDYSRWPWISDQSSRCSMASTTRPARW